MKVLLLTLAILQTLYLAASCPTECSCFGFNGQWIADCARRGLTVAPSGFDPNTTEIHMQYNEIETVPANAFDGLSNAKHLYLQSNKIASLPAGIFDDMTQLETLRINSNRITDIGTNMFSKLKQLQLLYIHDNDLNEVKNGALAGLENVEQVSVAGNPNLASIEVDAFSNLKNLTMIDMSGSALTIIDPTLVNRNPKLKKVYTYDIDTIDCTAIGPYLTYMDENEEIADGESSMICAKPDYLRGKSVQSFDPDKNIVAAGSCPSTCTCFGSGKSFIADCANRELSELPVGFAPETTEIFLQNNTLTSLPDNNFVHLTKLEYLYLHSNEIVTLGTNAFTGPAQTLKQLTLNKNQITNLPTGVFNGMRSLEVLNLNDNRIKALEAGELSDMVALVQFSINMNSVGILPEKLFFNLVSLKYIGLAQNNITNVPDDLLTYSHNLYYADLSDNVFIALPKIPSAVTRFEVRDSRIKSLMTSNFADAENLAVLDLSGNEIYMIEEGAFDGAKKLQNMYLANNHIEAITDETFASATKLVLLDLARNSKLTTISENAFYGQRTTLQRLDLKNCGLTTMSGKVLSSLENADSYLEGNPWNCDCKLKELAGFIEANPGKVDDPTCSEPKEQQGQKVIDVSYEEACEAEVPQDDSLALVMSLSIVGAVLIFAVVVGVIMYKSNQSNKSAMGLAANGGKASFKNTAYTDDEFTGRAVAL